MSKFIYVLSHECYRAHLNKSIYRFIPKGIVNRFEKMIKPRIVCRFIGKNEEDVKGYGIGISLLNPDEDKEKFIQRLVVGVKQLDINGVNKIILDDIESWSENDLSKIQESFPIQIVDGRKTLIKETLNVIIEICKRTSKDIRNQEFLIIGDSSEATKQLALEIAKKVNFLTLKLLDEDFGNEIANEILLETGLAIYNAYEINNQIHKYNFIINLLPGPEVSINKMKKRTVVFDLGVGRSFSHDIRGLRRDIMVISDFLFSNRNKVVSDNGSYNFGKELNSYIYEGLNVENKKKDLIKIKISPRTYTIKQACDLFLGSRSNKIRLM